MSALSQWDRYEMKNDPPRHRAVELFEQDVAYAELEGRQTVTMPVFAAKIILACAKDGQHLGQGRKGHPPDSETDRIAKAAVVWTAQIRWAEFGWKRGTKLRAAQETLNEVRGTRGNRLGKRVNFTPGYLMRLMGEKPEA